jgi:hypothetical protein
MHRHPRPESLALSRGPVNLDQPTPSEVFDTLAAEAHPCARPAQGAELPGRARIPDLRRLPPGETFRPFHVSETRVGFDEYDTVNQGLVSHHYRIVDGYAEASSGPFRYVWPAELDLMARIAGLMLVARWDGWDRATFTADSTSHISVWQRR